MSRRPNHLDKRARGAAVLKLKIRQREVGAKHSEPPKAVVNTRQGSRLLVRQPIGLEINPLNRAAPSSAEVQRLATDGRTKWLADDRATSNG